MKKRKTAGELNNEVSKDKTKYDAFEVGDEMSKDIEEQLYLSINKHKHIINENEFCVVMLISKDPLITHLLRRKFYCWPYLPSPRPNQAVFLYNKELDRITKRLWILPSDMVMAELCSLTVVDKKYVTMKKWSDAFFHGWVYQQNVIINPKTGIPEDKGNWVNTRPSHFFNVIRDEHKINLPSEHEYILSHKDELLKAGCKPVDSSFSDPFDFSKISVKQVVNSNEPVFN